MMLLVEWKQNNLLNEILTLESIAIKAHAWSEITIRIIIITITITTTTTITITKMIMIKIITLFKCRV